MDNQQFGAWIRELYSIFGKNNPSEPIMSAIYRRVEHLPDDFLDYAMSRLEDSEKLPANLGRELYRVLWPEYLEKHPELRGQEASRQACPSCSPDTPGFFWAWALNGHRYLLKCACNSRQDLAHLDAWTHERAMQAGLRLQDPCVRRSVESGVENDTLPVGNIRTQDAWTRTRALTEDEREDYVYGTDASLSYAGGW